MHTLREIKDELTFNIELLSLLEVMKNVSILEFRNLQKNKARLVDFVESIDGFFQMVDFRRAAHPFVSPMTDKWGIVMITSDAGFMGGLNMQVVTAALNQDVSKGAEFIVVGQKGQVYLKDMKMEYTGFPSTTYEKRYKLILELRDYIAKRVLDGHIGGVKIFYPKCISFMVQRIDAVHVLPMFEAERSGSGINYDEKVIIESPLAEIAQYLGEEVILEKLLEAFEDSKLSEFSARVLHLERSSRGLEEKKKAVRLQYLRAYHSRIDTNTRELFSAKVIRNRQ